MKNSNRGFTLVELAIVMVVIGLLIGGVLKGQELIESSRTTSVINQVKGFSAATDVFFDKYGAYPGDLMQAAQRVPGCGGTCYGGNGDGVVGLSLTTATYQSTQAGTGSSPRVETAMFWKQLAYADLITGVNPAANVTMPEYGQTHPASSLGGGFDVFSAPGDMIDVPGGLVLRLQSALAFSSDATTFIPSSLAQRIDQKIDDGFPDTGFVRADFNTNCDTGSTYLNTSTSRCMMYFNIKR